MKELKKSANKKICGVCGGIAEYLGIDATVIRLLWVFYAFMCGLGFITYITCALIMPEDINE